MSKKQLDTQNVLSELSGQSAFFRKEPSSEPEARTKPTARPPERATGRTADRAVERSTEQDYQPPPKKFQRILRRYSFEAYDDQVRQLKKISLQAEIDGETRSISEMIREAIDTFLKSENKTNPPDRPNG